MDSNSTPWSSSPHPSIHAEVVTVAPTIFPRVGYSILSFLMFINTVLSVFNNGLVITVMVRNPSLLQPMNAFILSLAVSDLMIGLCGSLVVTITNYQGSFFIGHAACVFQGFAVNYFGKWESRYFRDQFLFLSVPGGLLYCYCTQNCKAKNHFAQSQTLKCLCCRPLCAAF